MIQVTSRMTSFPNIYRGVVTDTSDPKNLGRCKVHVPDVYGNLDYDTSLLPWARPVMAGVKSVPEIDSLVYVVFEGGSKSAPLYISGVVTTKSPVDPSTDVIYEKGDCRVSYDKGTSELTLQVKESKLTVSEDGISGSSNSLGPLTYSVVGVIQDD